jgi:hypothetical protein
METIETYLLRKNKELTRKPQTCEDVAVETARVLFANGITPTIVEFSDGRDIIPASDFFDTKGLVWRMHQACCSQKIIYDPFLGMPSKIDYYVERFLGRKVPYRAITDPVSIYNHISRHIMRDQIQPTMG